MAEYSLTELSDARERVIEAARGIWAGPTGQQKLREALDKYDELLARLRGSQQP